MKSSELKPLQQRLEQGQAICSSLSQIEEDLKALAGPPSLQWKACHNLGGDLCYQPSDNLIANAIKQMLESEAQALRERLESL